MQRLGCETDVLLGQAETCLQEMEEEAANQLALEAELAKEAAAREESSLATTSQDSPTTDSETSVPNEALQSLNQAPIGLEFGTDALDTSQKSSREQAQPSNQLEVASDEGSGLIL